jgi:hypothetical protein
VTVALDEELARRLIDELVYERLRREVDLEALGWIERDVEHALRMAGRLDDDEDDDPPVRVLVSALIDRAWSRLVEEWRELRVHGTPACPLCELERRAEAS